MKLSEKQQKIVAHGEGALLVEAGPGSGKTRVLTERIRRLINESDGHFRVLALTFTNKAANEMKERLEEFQEIHSRAFIGTLHSFCAEVLANRGKPVGIDGMPNLFENFQDRKQVLQQAMLDDPELRHELLGKGDPKEQNKALFNWLESISTAKTDLKLPETLDDSLIAKIYAAYDDGLRASNAVDYDDLLLFTYRLFTERPKIANFYRRLYRYICVDEAQDLNEAQYRVIQALCGDTFKNVMFVGDPRQAIFQWNGAHPKYLDFFARDFKAKKIVLNENYRSSRAIVEAARLLDPGYEVESEYPIPGDIRLLVAEDEHDEAKRIVEYLSDLLDNGHDDIEGPVTLGGCAILGRNRYVFSAIEEALSRQDWDFYKHLSTQHNSESDLLRDFELCLRLKANPRDRLHLEVLLKRWEMEDLTILNTSYDNSRELFQAVSENIRKQDARDVLKAIENLGQEEHNIKFSLALNMLKEIAEKIDDENGRALILQDIKEWSRAWDHFLRSERGGEHRLASFLGHIALGATQQPRQDGLALLTIHSAKGLEFDVVVVMGMMEGVFPDYRAKGADLEEEKRNFFVAVTRSKRLLCLSYAKSRVMPWGSSRRQDPSRFLEQIGLTSEV
ncbi:ATP-dependent helicase [Geothermobacter hydrogeniphilus]|uniref:DNA 3'-5' helicase n=1 Tax=Geothermobacter hydrogeniphilus TaxID=1969733 RepID=A0A2K2H5K0_9BACT|nr:ATP-dependent helicase [Geothermobacter hydrogeniphilus]PNU18604.1 ATP-dependent helicase [Geothermobacter hydrogeniphilus]